MLVEDDPLGLFGEDGCDLLVFVVSLLMESER